MPRHDDDVVRSLYKAAASCADHHESAFLKSLHIRTGIDDAILLAARNGKVVLVTGNPGDGKTHLIRRLKDDELPKIAVNEDANQHDDDELIRSIDKAISAKHGLVMAINEGVLLSICQKATRRSPWAQPVINAILAPYVYDGGESKPLDHIVLLDLNLRNNLAREIVSQAIDRVVRLVDPAGPLARNAERLKDKVVQGRLANLLDAVGRTGFHATMRDVLGFIAYLICGGEDGPEQPPRPYYLNAFEEGIGLLFDRVREFDPLSTPDPFLDDRLFMAQDTDDEWVHVPDDERREKEILTLFQQRKRRAFFEHKDGEKILRQERSDVDRVFGELVRTQQSPEQVAVRLLNRFFESRDTTTESGAIEAVSPPALPAPAPAAAVPTPVALPMPVPATPPTIELRLPNGMRIGIGAGFSPQVLSQVIACVGGRPC